MAAVMASMSARYAWCAVSVVPLLGRSSSASASMRVCRNARRTSATWLDGTRASVLMSALRCSSAIQLDEGEDPDQQRDQGGDAGGGQDLGSHGEGEERGGDAEAHGVVPFGEGAGRSPQLRRNRFDLNPSS